MKVVGILVIGVVIGLVIRELIARSGAGERRAASSPERSTESTPSAAAAATPTTDTPVIHTSKIDEGWEVRREGDDDAVDTFDTKAEAQAAGRELAKEEAGEHVIHRVDDSVGEHRDYSNTATPADADADADTSSEDSSDSSD